MFFRSFHFSSQSDLFPSPASVPFLLLPPSFRFYFLLLLYLPCLYMGTKTPFSASASRCIPNLSPLTHKVSDSPYREFLSALLAYSSVSRGPRVSFYPFFASAFGVKIGSFHCSRSLLTPLALTAKEGRPTREHHAHDFFHFLIKWAEWIDAPGPVVRALPLFFFLMRFPSRSPSPGAGCSSPSATFVDCLPRSRRYLSFSRFVGGSVWLVCKGRHFVAMA